MGPADITRWLSVGAQVEEETDTERLNDAIITGLRTSAGLDMSKMPAVEAEAMLSRARRHLRAGTLELRGARLCIPEQHWIVSDGIMCDLLA